MRCEVSSLDGTYDGLNVASNLIGAAVQCDIDEFLCTINVADAADNLLTMAMDIRAATQVCPQQRESLFKKWLKKEHPDWLWMRLLNQSASSGSRSVSKDKFFKPEISSLYRATVNGRFRGQPQDSQNC